MNTRMCPVCDKIFMPEKAMQFYCKRKHQVDYKHTIQRSKRREARPNFQVIGEKFCKYCGKSFKYYDEYELFCSHSCISLYSREKGPKKEDVPIKVTTLDFEDMSYFNPEKLNMANFQPLL